MLSRDSNNTENVRNMTSVSQITWFQRDFQALIARVGRKLTISFANPNLAFFWVKRPWNGCHFSCIFRCYMWSIVRALEDLKHTISAQVYFGWTSIFHHTKRDEMVINTFKCCFCIIDPFNPFASFVLKTQSIIACQYVICKCLTWPKDSVRLSLFHIFSLMTFCKMLPRILVENLIVGIKHHEIKYQKYPVVSIGWLKTQSIIYSRTSK